MDQITTTTPLISAEERERRIEAVNYARGSVRLEGFILSADTEALFQRYVDGELTLAETGNAIRALYAA